MEFTWPIGDVDLSIHFKISAHNRLTEQLFLNTVKLVYCQCEM